MDHTPAIMNAVTVGLFFYLALRYVRALYAPVIHEAAASPPKTGYTWDEFMRDLEHESLDDVIEKCRVYGVPKRPKPTTKEEVHLPRTINVHKAPTVPILKDNVFTTPIWIYNPPYSTGTGWCPNPNDTIYTNTTAGNSSNTVTFTVSAPQPNPEKEV